METQRSLFSEFKLQIKTLTMVVGLLWAIEIIDIPLGGWLDTFGILPRTAIGLRGILFSPFLHGNFMHLISNTVPLIVLSWFIMLSGIGDWLMVTLIAGFLGGLGTWLIGSPAIHIGASGVIFGYFGFLIARGYFERSFASIAFAVLVTFLYGGIITGVAPGQAGISWEGHLCGLIGGIIAARLLTKDRSKPRSIADKYDL
ncbi:MAG: rhomboid family intramembrane serine protease [Cyanobacteria bacterium J06634_6]